MTCPFIVENSLFKHHKGGIPSGSVVMLEDIENVQEMELFMDTSRNSLFKSLHDLMAAEWFLKYSFSEKWSFSCMS
jgi:hypothetical protein